MEEEKKDAQFEPDPALDPDPLNEKTAGDSSSGQKKSGDKIFDGSEIYDRAKGGFEGAKWYAAMAYLPLVCMVPLFLNRDNEYIQKHAKQGFILFMIELIAMMLKIDAIWDLLIFVCLAVGIIGALSLLVRGEIHIPVLSDLADKLKI